MRPLSHHVALPDSNDRGHSSSRGADESCGDYHVRCIGLLWASRLRRRSDANSVCDPQQDVANAVIAGLRIEHVERCFVAQKDIMFDHPFAG